MIFGKKKLQQKSENYKHEPTLEKIP